jgi:7-cyano-7-deazaguanine reductase
MASLPPHFYYSTGFEDRPMTREQAEKMSQTKDLKALGKSTEYNLTQADSSILETFPSVYKNIKVKGASPIVKLPQPVKEFTSLCPLTGQPDFADIYVEYQPRDKMLESKSWKLYLFSFRTTAEFHEACVTKIFNDLHDALDPLYLHVQGNFTPRGGISIVPRIEWWAPDFNA